MIRFSLFFCVFILGASFPVFAQVGLNPDRDEPVEITADASLEWHRNDLYFRAVKNVKAVQGDTTLYSDLLTAKYRDGKEKSVEIYTIQANGSVRIFSAQSKVYGQKAVYDVDRGYVVMTGNNLKLVSADQTVTARDKFEYWVADGKLVARGRAVAVREGDRIESEELSALFTEDKTGKRSLKSLEGAGNVVITTPDEVLKGDRVVYSSVESTATLYDNVKITRGPNVLEGSKAVLNTQTNVSKIFGGVVTKDGGTGRVRGVFYPGSTKSPESAKEAE